MPTLVNKPKLIHRGDNEEQVIEKTNYNVIDLWKRLNDLKNEFAAYKKLNEKTSSDIRLKNWRFTDYGTYLTVDYRTATGWVEQARWFI